MQHDPRLRTVNATQHGPCPGGRDAHRAGRERGRLLRINLRRNQPNEGRECPLGQAALERAGVDSDGSPFERRRFLQLALPSLSLRLLRSLLRSAISHANPNAWSARPQPSVRRFPVRSCPRRAVRHRTYLGEIEAIGTPIGVSERTRVVWQVLTVGGVTTRGLLTGSYSNAAS